MSLLSEQLDKLLAGPEAPGCDYVFSKTAYAELYAIAASLQQSCFASKEQETVCLCTTDKAAMAAALLAAVTRPVTLIIPHAFSEPVLARMHEAHPFSKAILSQSNKNDEAAALPAGVEKIRVDREAADAAGPFEPICRNPDRIFVKLFTGGSTGTPAIWSKTVRNLFGEALYHARKLAVTPEDRIAATVPPNHIYGLLFSVLMPLVASASVIDDIPTYPQEIQQACRRDKASILISIPLHYKMLNTTGLSADTLRRAISSAAPLDPADSQSFYRQTGVGVTEVYGSTETGGIATRCCAKSETPFTVLDCIRWQITEERLAIRSDFISPELPRTSDGFFITSDRARASGTDTFELGGRADRIVKVAGKRVDLDEVKSAITRMPEVRNAAVICVPDKSARNNEIRALVETEADKDAIRQFLRNRLEAYALPRRIRITDKMPLYPTGKYDSRQIEALLDESQAEAGE
jgi:acyl-coenzyme A synthetase/AMP-(fatty) acid ligase